MSFPLGSGPSLSAPSWDASLDGAIDDSSFPMDPEQAMHRLRRQWQPDDPEAAESPGGLWSGRTARTRSPSVSSSEAGDADDAGAAEHSTGGPRAHRVLEALATAPRSHRCHSSRYVPTPRSAVRPPPIPTPPPPSPRPAELRSLPEDPSSLLTRHRLNEPAAAVRRIARSLPIDSAGHCEVLVRLRAITAHLAGAAADEHERRTLALALLNRGMVSHMTQMNHAHAHHAQVSATSTDHGVQARAVWMRQDAAQSAVNAVYMSLLSRLSNHGVLSRDEVWRAVTGQPHRCHVPSYLCATARTLAERPPQPSPRRPDAVDLHYAHAFIELLHAVLPMPTSPDDRTNFFRLGASQDPRRQGATPGPFFEHLLALPRPIGHAPLAAVCRALQQRGAGFAPPRRSRLPALACLGKKSMVWEQRFDAALGRPGRSPTPPAPPGSGCGQPPDYTGLSEDLARVLDFVRARQRWGLLDLVEKSPPSAILWREERRARQADAP